MLDDCWGGSRTDDVLDDNSDMVQNMMNLKKDCL